jgi:caa(3)-type oxidase subunit IV
MSAPHHGGESPAMDVHEIDHHLKDYNKIIWTLVVSTVIEFVISYLMEAHHVGFTMGVVLLVAIAFFKAILVAKFFMHIRYDPKPLAILCVTPLMLATPLLIIGCFDAIKGPSI